MKATTLKLVQSNKKDSIKTIKSVMTKIAYFLNHPLDSNTVYISDKINLSNLESEIGEKYPNTRISIGCLQGCYGSNTGMYDKGLSVYFDQEYVIDRYIDSDYGEIVNPWHLFNEHGKLLELEFSDEIEEIFENLGLSVKSDNTYNFATDFGGENSENAGFMYDFQFTIIQNLDKEYRSKVILKVMFHLGGDPRGNYTKDYLFQFDSIDDVYSVIYPNKHLSEVA